MAQFAQRYNFVKNDSYTIGSASQDYITNTHSKYYPGPQVSESTVFAHDPQFSVESSMKPNHITEVWSSGLIELLLRHSWTERVLLQSIIAATLTFRSLEVVLLTEEIVVDGWSL